MNINYLFREQMQSRHQQPFKKKEKFYSGFIFEKYIFNLFLKMDILENSPRETQSVGEQKLMFLEQQIMAIQGPSLCHFLPKKQVTEETLDLTGLEILRKLTPNTHHEIRLVGTGRKAERKSFCYVLLQIGMKQNKYYPHLNTLIKEQFYRPEMLIQYSIEQQKQILQTCELYFSQVRTGTILQEFFQDNIIFFDAFCHILEKIPGLASSQSDRQEDIILRLSKKFNVECRATYNTEKQPHIYSMGFKNKLRIIKESDIFFVAMQADRKTEDLNSFAGNLIQSQMEGDDFPLQGIGQISEQSTPKFKENIQSLHYRKKSHKNSFGGDFDVMNYKGLTETLNKIKGKSGLQKVFSQKYDEKDLGTGPIQMGKNITSNLMTGSNIEGHFFAKRERKNSKVITSQIFKGNFLQIPKAQPEYQMFNFSKKEEKVVLIENDENEQKQQNIAEPIIEIENSHRELTEQNSEAIQELFPQLLSSAEKAKIKNRKFSYLINSFKQDFSIEQPMKKSFHEPQDEVTQTKNTKIKHQIKKTFLSPKIDQLINIGESDHSNRSLYHRSRKKSVFKKNLVHQSNIISFQKDDTLIEPLDWTLKETIFYFDDQPPQKFTSRRNKQIINQPSGKKEVGNIRSTIDTHYFSNLQQLKSWREKKKDQSETSITKNIQTEVKIDKRSFAQTETQKNFPRNSASYTTLARNRSSTSTQFISPVSPHNSQKPKVKVTFNYVSANSPKVMINSPQVRKSESFIQNEFVSPKSTLKSFWPSSPQ